MFKKLYLICVLLFLASSVFAGEGYVVRCTEIFSQYKYTLFLDNIDGDSFARRIRELRNQVVNTENKSHGNKVQNPRSKGGSDSSVANASVGDEDTTGSKSVTNNPNQNNSSSPDLLIMAIGAIVIILIIISLILVLTKFRGGKARRDKPNTLSRPAASVSFEESFGSSNSKAAASFSDVKSRDKSGVAMQTSIPNSPAGGGGSNKRSALSPQISGLDKKFEDLKSGFRGELSRMQENLSGLDKKLEDLKSSFRGELSRMQENLQSNFKNILLEDRRGAMSSDMKAKESKIQELTLQVNSLNREIVELKGSLNDANGERNRLASSKLGIEKKLEALSAENLQKDGIISEKDDKISELSEQSKKDKESIEKLESERAKLLVIKDLIASRFKSYMPRGLLICDGKDYVDEIFEELFIDDSPSGEAQEAQIREKLIIFSNLIVLNVGKSIDDRDVIKNSLLAIGKSAVKLHKLQDSAGGSTFSYLKTWIESLNNGILSDTSFRLKIPMERQSFDSSTMIHEGGSGSNVRDISVWGIYQKDERNNLSCQVKARVIC